MPRYFAFGSNMTASQMADRCPGAVPIGTALLRGFTVAFTRYSERRGGGVADIRPREGAVVYGVLWDVSDADLAVLDRHEGVAAGAYRRITVTVEPATGGPGVDAITYQVVEPRGEHIPPSSEYLAVLIEGASEHALPGAYIEGLRTLAAATAGD